MQCANSRSPQVVLTSVVNHTLQVTFPIASKKSNTLSLLVQVKFHVGKCIVINYCMLQVSQNLTIWFMVCAYNYHSKCSITLDNSYVLTKPHSMSWWCKITHLLTAPTVTMLYYTANASGRIVGKIQVYS